MPSLDQIRTIYIQYRSDGADRITSELNKLDEAQRKLGESSDTSAKRQVNAAALQQSLLNKYDAEYRAQTQIAQALQKIQLVRGAGLIGQQEETRLVDLATKYHLANVKSLTEVANAAGLFANGTASVREGLHALHPVLDAAGVQFGGMRSYSAAAGLGMVALAGILTGVVAVALTKSSDQARILNAELAAITGSKAGGQNAFAGIKASAEAASIPLDTIAGAYQTLLVEQQKLNAQRGIVFAPGAETSLKQINDITTAIALSGKIGLLTADQIKQAENTIAQSFVQSGKLTADAFSKLPFQIQSDIASAFGGAGQNIGVFQLKVDGLNLTFDKVAAAAARLRPQLQETADHVIPTLGQGIDGVRASWEHLLQTLNDTGTWNVVSGAINLVSGTLTALSVVIRAVAAALRELRNIGNISGGIQPGLANNTGNIYGSEPGGFPIGGEPAFPSQGYGSPLSPEDYNAHQGSSPLQFATGTGGIRTVPPGFPDDKYQIRLSSGEQYAVAPPGYNLIDMLVAQSSIKVPGYADGTFGGTPDAATTDQGHSLLDLGVSNQGLLQKLGVTLDDWRQTITGAGNDKIQDVIRQSTIQIITSESMSCSKIVAAIGSSANGIISAVGAMTAAQQASAAASSSGSSASYGGNAATSSAAAALGMSEGQYLQMMALKGVGAVSYSGNSRLGSSDPLGAGAIGKALGNVDYAGGPVTSSSRPASNYVAPPWLAPTGTAGGGTSIAIPQNAFPSLPGLDRPGTLSPGFGNVGENSGNPYDSGLSSVDFAGAQGGDFIVPPGFENDTFITAASSGERVRIQTPAQFDDSKGAGGVTIINHISPTIIMDASGNAGKSKQQVAEELSQSVADAIAAKSSANRSIGPYSSWSDYRPAS